MTATPILRVAVTTIVLLAAVVLAYALWHDYMYSPWTRDGRVRARVVRIAPDVSGIVREVKVVDNQVVRRGDVLFVIDDARFRAAIERADAEVLRAQAQMLVAQALVTQRASERRMRRDQAQRRKGLDGEVISAEAQSDIGAQSTQAGAVFEAAQAEQKAAEAALQAAMAARHAASIDLERSTVRAPADGHIVNLDLYAGDYAVAGTPHLALVESRSFWVYGYFEETKLAGIRVGEPVTIQLLASRVTLKGHVESLANAITDRDNPAGGDMLADVNPVFTWIRLAQRIPVRIAIDQVPDGANVAAGMTCTVVVNDATR